MKREIILSVVILAALLDSGCSQEGPSISEQILALAGQEAKQIQTPKDRLRWELNIAQDQLYKNQYAEADLILNEAKKTLEEAATKGLDERTHLAGWVSLSELWDWNIDEKHILNPSAASAALDQAISLLKSIDPPSQRVYYVRSIAAEIRLQRSNDEAEKLLLQAADWAGQIDFPAERRKAFFGIAYDLFYQENDLVDGQSVVYRETDAAWRTEMLYRLANPYEYDVAEVAAGVPGLSKASYSRRRLVVNSSGGPQDIGDTSIPDENFGISLDYRSYFGPKDNQRAQTRPVGE
jgi:hypothetical protein